MPNNIILYVLSVAYITRLFFYGDGPFRSKTRRILVRQPNNDLHYRPVNLFDWPMRLLRMYKIRDDVWERDVGTLDCPYCLGFWINLICLPALYFLASDTYTLDTYIFLIFSVPLVVGFINERLL